MTSPKRNLMSTSYPTEGVLVPRTHVRVTSFCGVSRQGCVAGGGARLRAAGMTMPDIAEKLGVSRSSVSLWTRDVPIPLSAVGRRRSIGPRRNRLHDAKVAEIERLKAEGVERIGRLSEREFLVAGAALYAGEGTKAGNEVHFANSDPRMIAFFCA